MSGRTSPVTGQIRTAAITTCTCRGPSVDGVQGYVLEAQGQAVGAVAAKYRKAANSGSMIQFSQDA
jgi:hypothetical protein